MSGQTKKKTIIVGFNLTERHPDERHDTLRSLKQSVLPIISGGSRAGGRQAGWVFTGTIRSRVTADSDRIAFSDQPNQDHAPVRHSVTLRVAVPHQRIDVRADTPDVVQTELQPLGASRYRLHVSPHPSLTEGPFECRIAVELIDEDGQRCPGREIRVQGVMQSPLRALPAALSHGLSPVGSSPDADVVLAAATDGWVLDRVEVDSPHVSVRELAADGRQFHFRVRHEVVRPGEQSAQITFTYRNADRRSRVGVTSSVTGETKRNGSVAGGGEP